MSRSLLLLSVLSLFAGGVAADDVALSFKQNVAPVLKGHCVDCHGGSDPAAGLDLERLPTSADLATGGAHWFKVLDQVTAGTMPPAEAEPLTASERAVITMWVRGGLTDLLVERQRTEGRSRLRRLSREEYGNTVQDIFGIRPPVLRLLPGDGRVDGYDKVSGALPFSPASTEGQMRIAEEIVTRMFTHPQDRVTTKLWSRGSEQSKGHVLELDDNWNVSFNTDTTSGPLRKAQPDGTPGNGFPGPRKPGWHRIRIHAYGYQTDEPLPVGIYAGHVFAYPQILELVDIVDIPPGTPSVVETDVYLRTNKDNDIPGSGVRLIPLGLGVPVPKNTQASVRGKGKPGLALQWVELVELEDQLPGQKLLFEGLPEPVSNALRPRVTLQRSKLSREDLQSALGPVFARIGARLFRRDLTADELSEMLTSFLAAADSDVPLRDAFVAEVVGLMTAPDFLTVVEAPGELDDFDLASRLAYFLWNSTPDPELLQVAREGRLSDPPVLRAQTERLLRDEKSDRFVTNFLEQWLGLWGIENTTPDRDLYPEYDEELQISSVAETEATFRHMLDQNLSVRDFVAPDWAMLNTRLAEHYELPAVSGFGVRKVSLPEGTPFGGLWTQAATMKVTANGTLTSPIKRGVWVAERLLGEKIPPPPPTVDAIDPDTRGAKTLREQLTLHAAGGSCAACHARFDPYGFALESFDVMGCFRTHYRVHRESPKTGEPKWTDGPPVDPAGVTPGGQRFADVHELRQALASHPERLARGVTRHLLTYATGEPASPVDQRAVDSIVRSTSARGYGLRDLIHGVVQSELFRRK